MIIYLPILPATFTRFRGERTVYLVQHTELHPFAVPEATEADCPIVRQEIHGDVTVTWRMYGDWLIRPILNGAGVPADLTALQSATAPELVHTGGNRAWWHDHPSSQDRALLATGNPLKSPVFPETVRDLDIAVEARPLIRPEQEAVRIARLASNMVLVDGMPHIRSEGAGWMVSKRPGDFIIKRWLPGAPGSTVWPTMFLPGDDMSIAEAFVEYATETSRRRARPVTPKRFDTAQVDRATLRSVILQLQTLRLGSVSGEFIASFARARSSLLGEPCADWFGLVEAIGLACQASGISKLTRFGHMLKIRERLIDRSLLPDESWDDALTDLIL